jgi:putative endopeptidase
MSYSLNDFYTSVNKKWLDSHEIPGDDTSFSIFDELEKSVRGEIIDIIHKERRKNTPAGHFIESIYTGRDNDLETIEQFIEELTHFSDHSGMLESIGRMNLYGLNAPISLEISYDSRDTHKYCVYLTTSVLGILKHDYAEKSGEVYKKYKQYLTDVGKAANIPQMATRFLDIESRFAKIHHEKHNSSKIELIYNPFSYALLCKQFHNINFAALLRGSDIPTELAERSLFVVAHMEYITLINDVIHTISLADWKLWIKCSIYLSFIQVLPAPFEKLHFDFYVKFMKGQKKDTDAEHKTFLICDDMIEDSISKLYLAANSAKFKAIKTGATKIYEKVISAAKERVLRLNWLSPSSRQIARHKLDHMGLRMAYPEKFSDEFGQIQIDKTQFLKNVLLLRKHGSQESIAKLHGETPEQRAMWESSIYEVNAFYYTEMNEFAVPLGFLRPPFYSVDASFLKNLAGLGNIIAHEIAHGFDEEGRKFDASGNYFPWWSSIDVELYNNKTRQLINEFNKQKYFGLPVNGKLTLGENLADFGAIAICMDVLRKDFAQRKVSKAKRLEELREFFIHYAYSWAFKERSAVRKLSLETDVHAPPQLRVNVVCKHFDEFYEAFGFTEKDEGWIAPEDRIDIWG